MPRNVHALPEFLWRHYANLMCVGAMLLMYAVLAPLPLFAGAMPMLVACVVGYGAMQRIPISLWLLAGLGLIQDVATGLPLGVTVVQLLVLYLGLARYIDAIEDMGFMTRYLWVGLGLGACFLMQYMAVGFLMREWLPVGALVLPWVVTVLCYPLMHWVLLVLQRRLYRRIWVFLPPEYKPVS